MIRQVAILIVATVSASSALGQGMSVGTSTSGGNLSPNGIRSDGALGSGGGFRPNNSTFGSPSSLSAPTAGGGTNPFLAAEDPQSIGRAALGSVVGGAGGQQNFNQGARGGNTGRGGNFGNQFGFNAGNQFQQNRSMNGSQRPLRSVTRIGFEHVGPNEEVLTRSVRSSLDPSVLPGIRDVNVDIDNGIAVIRGSAQSDHHARLAAAMLSLEPGIHTVQNRLQVEPGRR